MYKSQMELRREASARGERFYETGRPCRHDHIAPRRVDSGACTQCLKDLRPAAKIYDPNLSPVKISVTIRKEFIPAHLPALEAHLRKVAIEWTPPGVAVNRDRVLWRCLHKPGTKTYNIVGLKLTCWWPVGGRMWINQGDLQPEAMGDDVPWFVKPTGGVWYYSGRTKCLETVSIDPSKPGCELTEEDKLQ